MPKGKGFPASKGLNYAKLLAKTHKVNLEKSAAIGDSLGDVRILKNVGKPVVFSPSSQRLINIANKKKWPVVHSLAGAAKHL